LLNREGLKALGFGLAADRPEQERRQVHARRRFVGLTCRPGGLMALPRFLDVRDRRGAAVGAPLTMVIAVPVLPARPVRPMRWT
jgi:hypothetical protein